jgi:hypothetical protein
MRIKVEVHGHQQFFEYEGEPLAWLNTTEKYEGGAGAAQTFQAVPAVVLRTQRGVEVISLRTQYTWSKITEVGP